MATPTPHSTRDRLASASLALIPLAFCASVTSAEVVRFAFTGVVTEVSGADPQMIDLRDTFSPGDPAVIVFSINRSFEGYTTEPTTMGYYGALQEAAFRFGKYRLAEPATEGLTGMAVCNGLLETRMEGFLPVDIFTIQTMVPSAPAIGAAQLSYLVVDLRDHEASVFPDTRIPETLPPVEEFEIAQCQLQFLDGINWGFVDGIVTTITTMTTPGTVLTPSTSSQLSTWGRVKSSYRN